MHEGHFTDQIVDVIIQELKKYPGKKIRAVRVKVGEVYHLVLESVLMHFEVKSKGTSLEGVTLHLTEDPVVVVCDACGHTGPVEDHHLLLCTSCHSRQVKTISGDAIMIESMECV